MVAHGMFSMYRKEVLQSILDKRGYVYDINCITEDYELTLAIKNLGWKIGNNTSIKAYTEVPMTLKELFIQRIRWMTGGLHALSQYSFNRYTYRDKLGHVLFLLLFGIQLYLIVNSIIHNYSIIGYGLLVILSVSLVNVIVRYKYVTHKSTKNALFMITLIPDIFISWFQTFVMLNAYIRFILKLNTKW